MSKVFHLENGLTCVCDERPDSGKATMKIYIKSGSLYEDYDENGLTYLMQDACLGGTASRNREEIAEEIESKGGSIACNTTRRVMCFEAVALKKDVEKTFEILSDVLRNPQFSEDEVNKSKRKIIQWIKTRDEEPARKAARKFYEVVFAGQSIANDPMGNEDLLKSFSIEQIKKKHEEVLSNPEDFFISFSGDITEQEAKTLAEKYFKDLPKSEAKKDYKSNFISGDYRENNDNEQLNISFGFEAPPLNDDDAYIMMLFNEALSGGMSCPLFQEIREKRGLVYGVGSNYEAFEKTGLFVIRAGTGKGNVGELISVSFELLGGIIKNGFSEEDLVGARERILRSFVDKCETSNGVSSYNVSSLMQKGYIISYDEIKDRLAEITSDDIRRVCGNMLQKGNFALSGVGPQDSMPSDKKIKEMMSKQLEGISLPKLVKKEKSNKDYSKLKSDEIISAVEPEVTILKNGMRIVTVQRAGNLSCGAWVGAGSDSETPEMNGATHMNEHMMFKGTPSYGAGSIDKIIEGELSGSLNAYTSNDRTAYYFYSLDVKDIEKVVDICGEMVFEANIDHDEFNGKDGNKGERDVVIEEIAMYEDSVGSKIWEGLFATSYPDQSHGRPVLGTEKILRAMTVEQLRAYRDEFYTANNVVFSAVGNIKHEDFVALIEKKFGHMPKKDFKELPMPSYKGGICFNEMKPAKNCTIGIAAEGVSALDKELPAYEMLGDLLSGGMSSRLYKEIVVKKELAPDIGSGAIDYRNCGMFYVGGDVDADKVKPFINTVYSEITRLTRDLSQEEMDKVKAGFKMKMLQGLEANHNICNYHANNTLAFGKKLTVKEILDLVENLTVDDIKKVAKKVLTSVPALSVIAPIGTDRSYIPSKAELTSMRDGNFNLNDNLKRKPNNGGIKKNI